MTTAEDLGIQGIEEVEALDVDGSVIFRARQAANNRRVAVKILDPFQEPLIPRRFDLRRKPLTKFAERTDVVPVYEVGTTPKGQQYLLMPYFDGGSLADQLPSGPMAWERAARLIKETAETVAEAHDLGLVLGDIKPSSIMLNEASAPTIAVYGMATRRFDDGRPTYAAPEVKPGVTLTPAADVYSLGLSLVALVAGRHPNRGRPSAEFLAGFEAVSPDWLVEMVTKSLSSSPGERYRDARVLAAALGTGLTVEAEPEQTAGPAPGLTLDLDELLGDAEQGDIVLSGLGSSRSGDHDGESADPFDFEALLELPTTPNGERSRQTIGVDEFLDLDDVLGVGEPGLTESSDSAPADGDRASDDDPAPVDMPAATVDSPPSPAADSDTDNTADDTAVLSLDETTADESPDDETPADDTTADESPDDETPDDDTAVLSLDDSSVDETVVEHNPLDGTGADESPTGDNPTGDNPMDDRPVGGEPSSDDATLVMNLDELLADDGAIDPVEARGVEPESMPANESTSTAAPPDPAPTDDPIPVVPATSGEPSAPAGGKRGPGDELIDLSMLPPPPGPDQEHEPQPVAEPIPAAAFAGEPVSGPDGNHGEVLQGRPPVPGEPESGVPADEPVVVASAPQPEPSLFDLPRAAADGETTSADDDPTAVMADPTATVTEGVIVEENGADRLFGPNVRTTGPTPQSGFGRPGSGTTGTDNPAVSIWDSVPSTSGKGAAIPPDATMEVPITRISEADGTLFPPRQESTEGSTAIGGLSQRGAGAGPAMSPHRPLVGNESVPFGGFERRASAPAGRGFFPRALDRIGSIWVDRRPGFTGLLAFVGFVAIAGAVGTLIVRDFRPSSTTATEIEGPETSITVVTGDGASQPVAPTSVPPVLPEPASTHVTRAARGTARRLTTTVATTLPPSTTSTAAPTSAGGSTTTPTTTAPTTTTAAGDDEDALPPLGPTARANTTPEGPTEPPALIRNAAVSRIGSTSARIAFDSPQCVTVLFTFSAAGGGPTSQLSGGSRCSNDHTLLLGTVTPPLEPATSYTVVITASTGSDADRTVLRFTTSG